MTSKNDFVWYCPLPPNPTPTSTNHQNVVVLPYYRPSPAERRCRRLRRCLLFSSAILLPIAAVFFLYPSDPSLQLVRVHLNRVRVNSFPDLALDLSFSLTVKVYNRDFFSLDYDSLAVSVGYRGRELGLVNSTGGKIRARGSSYVDTTLNLDGFAIIYDVFYLLEDLAKGAIPIDTVTKVEGNLGLFFFEIPLKASVSCEVYVNTNNQTIVRQDCYPELDAELGVGCEIEGASELNQSWIGAEFTLNGKKEEKIRFESDSKDHKTGWRELLLRKL